MKLCVMILVALCVSLTTSVILTGEYSISKWWSTGPTYLTLQVGGVSVYKPNDYTVRIVAQIVFDRTNVDNLNMDRNYLKYMPGSYSRLFPNLKSLVVRNAHVKYLTNADFAGLSQLNHLDFHENDIEHLPEDLFVGNTVLLSVVSFKGNKLTNIDSSFFNSLTRIIHFHFEGNPCINMYTPSITAVFKATVQANCRGPIIPDVNTGPPPSYEEFNTMNLAIIDFKKAKENLEARLRLSNDRIKELETTNNTPGQCSEDTTQLTKDLTQANNDIKLKNVVLEKYVLTIQMKDYEFNDLNKTLTATKEKCKPLEVW